MAGLRPTSPHAPAARLSRTAAILAALLVAGLSAAPAAHAGMFDDDEARRQILDLKSESRARLDKLEAANRAQLELANQLDNLKSEVAQLRGQVEMLTYELQQAQQRQKDFYLDLDTRLRKLEPQTQAAGDTAPAASGGDAPAAGAPAKPAANPQAEAKEYEAALTLFKGGKYKEAANAFDAFGRAHPQSDFAPSAQFWLGNSFYAQRDCKKAISAEQVVLSKWPDHAKAPDALLTIANCQQELGDHKGANQTLDRLVVKYPDSRAAQSAKDRLKKK